MYDPAGWHSPLRAILSDEGYLYYLPSVLHQTLRKRSGFLAVYEVIAAFGHDEAYVQGSLDLLKRLNRRQLIAVSDSLRCIAEIAGDGREHGDETAREVLHGLATRVAALVPPERPKRRRGR